MTLRWSCNKNETITLKAYAHSLKWFISSPGSDKIVCFLISTKVTGRDIKKKKATQSKAMDLLLM